MFLVGVLLAGLAPLGPASENTLTMAVQAGDGSTHGAGTEGDGSHDHGSHDHGSHDHHVGFPADYPHLDPATPPPCEETRHEPGVGTVCTDALIPSNMLAVLHADGTIGYTHGLDAAPEDPVASGTAEGGPSASALVAPERDPICVDDATTDHHMIAIYARPTDRADAYATKAGDIRTYIKRANGVLNLDAEANAANADYRIACTGGVIDVLNLVLPTTNAATTFNTVVDDIRAMGHNDPKVKYWVWADVSIYGCSGVGHVYLNDDPSTSNPNNGNAASMFGVTFGPSCSTNNNIIVMMHENAHNMGAVQTSAPNSSGFAGGAGGHCNDGDDIMCYADGGPDSNYKSNVCTARKFFDCNHDDYYNPRPVFDSYLDNHWNLGDMANRYVEIVLSNAAPHVSLVTCEGSTWWASEPLTCRFRATDADAGDGVYFLVDWGDGSPVERVPVTGYVAAGTDQWRTHTYSTAGSYTISATATDDHPTNAKTSDPTTLALTVHAANAAPQFSTLVSCSPSPTTDVDPTTCSFAATDADAAGVYYTVDFGDGSAPQRVPATGYVAPGALQEGTHTYRERGLHRIEVTVFDDGSPARTAMSATLVDVRAEFPCEIDVSGRMLAGVPTQRIEGTNARWVLDIPYTCAGEGFLLLTKGGVGPVFQVCWYSGGGMELACTSGNSFSKSGTIPAGVAKARVVMEMGLEGTFELRDA